ncbi:MAG: methyltransferase domain-containing protein [Chloroflexota bacterium]|nr:methyltransferase domain-containing protein [Chloroflexota bacterium]
MTAGGPFPEFRCVECAGPLTLDTAHGPAHLCCGDGSFTYPLLFHVVPVLLASPRYEVASACLDLREMMSSIDSTIHQLQDSLQSSPRHAARLERHLAAERWNRDLLAGLLPLLLRHVSTADVVEAAVSRASWSSYSRDAATILGYLKRDWSHLPESEREVRAIERSVTRQLAHHAPHRQRALVLGAGMGRVAHDLRSSFEQVVALDASVLMAALFQSVRCGALDFYEISAVNTRTLDDQIVPVRASMNGNRSASLAGQPDFIYVVASGGAIPLPDASVSVVLSIYFSDVVPFSAYSAEVKRVLAPGGTFVHYGPLGYHFAGRAEHYPADEFMTELGQLGFDVHEPSWSRSTLLRTHGRIDEWVSNNLCFSATKRQS